MEFLEGGSGKSGLFFIPSDLSASDETNPENQGKGISSKAA